MGITDEFLKKFAEGLGKSVSGLTDRERSTANTLYQQAFGDGEDKGGGSNISSSPMSLTTSEKNVGGALDMTGLFSDLKEGVKGAVGPLLDTKSISDDLNALITSAQDLGNNMGIGRARAGELRNTIADTIPEMVKLGITTDQGMQAIKDVPNALKTNTTVANETIVELAATSKFTGESVKDLVSGFASVGTQLSSVSDEMAGVANYAKSVGVNVKEVTSGVVSNLKNLNLFNFENGVQGMAKMTAQSAMLGVNMGKVFDKAESLLNPESAIEFSSALQRLGVTSSELLDPLSAMDMALNDPAKLQDQMTKVAQQFTRLKADGSGFEILPGAKLQLREVAKELGMSADELASMAIKSSDLDMKLKQIRFPSFAASEEDRTLIANMSQMKDGKAVVQIEEGGEKKEVAVEDLTAQQLAELKKGQADQAKSAEDLARDQLTVQQEIKNILSGSEFAVRMGVASQKPLQRIADANLELRGAAAKNLFGEKITAKEVRGGVSGISKPLEEAGASLITGGLTAENIDKITTTLIDIPKNITKSVLDILGGGVEGLKGALQDATAGVTSTYEGVGGIQKIEASSVNTNYIDQLSTIITNAKTNVEQKFNIEQKVDFTNSDGSLRNMSTEMLDKAYNHFMYQFPNKPEDVKTIDKAIKSVVTGP
jgi:hypothetical protein